MTKGDGKRGLNALSAILGNYEQATAFATTETNQTLQELKEAVYAHMKFQDDQAVIHSKLLDAILTELKGIRSEQR